MKREVKNDVLSLLFDTYRKSPSSAVDISEVAFNHGIDTWSLYEELCQAGYIRQEMVPGPNGSVYCSISLLGIAEIDALYVIRRYNEILVGLHKQLGSGNIVDILQLQPVQYQMALELSAQLVEMGLIEIGAASFSDNALFAQLTKRGKSKARVGGFL